MSNCQNPMYNARQAGYSASRTSSQTRGAGFYGNRGNVRRTVPVPQGAPSSGCSRESCKDSLSSIPGGMSLAMAYVLQQKWQNIYEPCRALERGTIFEDLEKPFLGKGGCCR